MKGKQIVLIILAMIAFSTLLPSIQLKVDLDRRHNAKIIPKKEIEILYHKPNEYHAFLFSASNKEYLNGNTFYHDAGLMNLIKIGEIVATSRKPAKPGIPVISNFKILDETIRAGERFHACFDFKDEDGDLATLEITWQWDSGSESHSLPLQKLEGKKEGTYHFRPMVGSGNHGNFSLSIQVIDKKSQKSNILSKRFFVY